jgi:hypothetical protein
MIGSKLRELHISAVTRPATELPGADAEVITTHRRYHP